MQLFAEQHPLTIVFIAALVVTTAILLMRAQRYFSQSRRHESDVSAVSVSAPHDPGHHLDAPPAAVQWEVKMHETARMLSAQLDSKLSALQALIADADRAAARLESVLREAGSRLPERETATGGAASQAEALRPPRPNEVAAANGGATQTQAAELSGSEQRREEIYTLADYGFDAAEIARRVGRPIGEVELILGLRAKQ